VNIIGTKTKAELEASKLESKNASVIALRKSAYIAESDPLAMEMLRGEIDNALGRVPTIEDIVVKVTDIKNRYPKVI
jgi:hypothetical protein